MRLFTQSLFQVRNFSTSNASNQLVKPPVQVFGIVGRYACALYSAASKKKSLEAVEKDLIRFQQSLKTDARLREIIENPLIKRAQKAEGLKAVAEKVSYKTETSNFLQALAENGRLTAVDGVINAFKLIMAAHRGEVTPYTQNRTSTHAFFLLGNMRSHFRPGTGRRPETEDPTSAEDVRQTKRIDSADHQSGSRDHRWHDCEHRRSLRRYERREENQEVHRDHKRPRLSKKLSTN